MKNNFIRKIIMFAYYSVVGLILEGFIATFLLASTAEGQNLRDVKVSVSAVNITLEQAFQLIEKKTNFKFLYNEQLIPVTETTTMDIENESLYDVLVSFAKDYGLTFSRLNNQIIVKKAEAGEENIITAIETCTVKGYVTDGDTKEALQGVTVAIRGTTIGTFTDKRGYYEINNLKPGKYTVAASYVGYAVSAKEITVSSGKTVEINFQLGQSALNLDEVVVTGSVSDRSIKESANPITIISPHELENRNLSSIGQVLGSVPGVVGSAAQDNFDPTGRANNSSAGGLNIRGYSPTSASGSGTKFIVDGIEVPNDQSINYLDPNQIEKIEVSRGPMSSTLYGAGASGGIVQIFTKKGFGNLKVDLKTMFTYKESKFQDSNPINSDYSLCLNGGKADFGYNVSVDYQYIPISRYAVNNGIDEKDYVISAGVNGSISNVKADVKMSYSANDFGSYMNNMWYLVALNDGWTNASKLYKSTANDVHSTNNSTNLTLNLRQAFLDNAYQSLVVGFVSRKYMQDSFTPTKVTAGTYYVSGESTYQTSSVKYFANINQPLFSGFKVDLTAGFNYIYSASESTSNNYTTTYGDNTNQSTLSGVSGSRGFVTNTTTGMFAEGLWGYNDCLFLTTGLRLEKNSSYGDDIGWYYTPRIGLTYIFELGDLTFKPRFSWGKSTQPIPETYKLGKTTYVLSFTLITLANPDLKPQTQEGYEIGTDIFLSNNYSIGITYYHQKVGNLIQSITFASDNPYTSISQYINVADVFNNGLELSAKALFNPFSIDLSSTILSSRYGSGFPYSSSAPFRVDGGRVIDIPSFTFFGRLTYTAPALLPWSDKGGRISIEYMFKGSQISTDYYAYNKISTETGKYPALTYREFDGYSTINLRADYGILKNISLFVDVTNLLNDQSIIGSGYPRNGRGISTGLNCSL